MRRLLAISFFAALTMPARAEYIEAPNYPKGQAQVNDSISLLHGQSDDVENSLEFTYGISDRLALVAAFDSRRGERENYDFYSSSELTAQLDVLKETQYLPGTAWRLTYFQQPGSSAASSVSTMAALEKKIGRIDNFINIAVGKTIGDNALGGAEFGIAAQSMYGLNNNQDNGKFSAGFEYFGDFGRTGALQGFAGKGQVAGPIIGFQPSKNLDTSLNYLVGLTNNAPRSTVTLEVNFTF